MGWLYIYKKMQVNKVAILIDGGFFIHRFQSLKKRLPKKQDVEALVKDIVKTLDIANHPNSCNILFRTYYYDCLPFSKTIKSFDGTRKIDYSAKHKYKTSMDFIHSLKTIDQFALRLGDLSFTGWKVDAQ